MSEVDMIREYEADLFAAGRGLPENRYKDDPPAMQIAKLQGAWRRPQ